MPACIRGETCVDNLLCERDKENPAGNQQPVSGRGMTRQKLLAGHARLWYASLPPPVARPPRPRGQWGIPSDTHRIMSPCPVPPSAQESSAPWAGGHPPSPGHLTDPEVTARGRGHITGEEHSGIAHGLLQDAQGRNQM